MKTNANIPSLRTVYERFKDQNLAKLFRDDLGEKSFRQDVEIPYKDIINKLDLTLTSKYTMEDRFTSDLVSNAETFLNNLIEYSKQGDVDFINRRQNYISYLNNNYVEFLRSWAYIFPDLFDYSLLQKTTDSVREEIEKHSNLVLDATKNHINNIVNNSIKNIDEKQNSLLKILTEKESKVKESIKRTARDISVSEAETQFDNARRHYRNQSILWGILSILIIGLFIYLSINFYSEQYTKEYIDNLKSIYGDNFSDGYKWTSIYHGIIRVSILFVIGAITAFMLKIFRANLHMLNHNSHRLRLTKSIQALINAANTDEQSDKILQQLVESIVSFGNSGLIQHEDDNIQLSKMTVDNITRTITSK